MNINDLLDKEFANTETTIVLNEIEVKNCNQIAENIQKEKTLLYCDGHYYEYESGVFLLIKEDKIRKFIKEKLKDKFTQFKAGEILHSLRVDVALGSSPCG